MKPISETAKREQAVGLNTNKLQAAACILASAAVSISLIYWVIQRLL